MPSPKSLIDVKLLQWNWDGLITITEEILHASLSKVSQARNAATISVSPVL